MEATGREIVRLTCICLHESDEQNVSVFTKTSDAQHGSLNSNVTITIKSMVVTLFTCIQSSFKFV